MKGNEGAKFQPAFFGLVMSLGILSTSSLLNGFTILSDILLYSAAIAFIFGAFVILAKTANRTIRGICRTYECRYGAFTMSSGLSVMLTRLAMGNAESLSFNIVEDFALLVILISIIRPAVLGKIRNSVGKVDSGLTNYPIALLAFSITLLHSFPEGSFYSYFTVYIGVATAVFAMLVFFRFQAGLFKTYAFDGLTNVMTDGGIFINMGYPALCSIFLFQAVQSLGSGMNPVSKTLILLIPLVFWIYSTAWYIPAIIAYITGNRDHSFITSKFAIVFPAGVYSTATYMISTTYFHYLESLSVIVLFGGISVLLVILAEFAYSFLMPAKGAVQL
ncbi:MAG: hypothetical protein QXN26_05045 [Thermoplasmataceae archaeon]